MCWAPSCPPIALCGSFLPFLVLIPTSRSTIDFLSSNLYPGSPGDALIWSGLERESLPAPLHPKTRLQPFCSHSLLLGPTALRSRNKFAKWDSWRPTTENPTAYATAVQALLGKWTCHSAGAFCPPLSDSASSRKTHLAAPDILSTPSRSRCGHSVRFSGGLRPGHMRTLTPQAGHTKPAAWSLWLPSHYSAAHTEAI